MKTNRLHLFFNTFIILSIVLLTSYIIPNLQGNSTSTLAAQNDRIPVNNFTETQNNYKNWKHTDTVKIPILMYHSITNKNQHQISISQFQNEMSYLKKNGYRTLTSSQVLYALRTHRIPQKKIVWITLDDGYKNSMTTAQPILRTNHQHATVNFVTGFSQKGPFLNLQDARLMKASNVIDFESHTVTHQNLTTLTYKQQLHELAESKNWLDSHLNQQTLVIVYPDGVCNRSTIKAAKMTGYQYGLSTTPGIATSNENNYQLPRQRVIPNMSNAAFVALLQSD